MMIFNHQENKNKKNTIYTPKYDSVHGVYDSVCDAILSVGHNRARCKHCIRNTLLWWITVCEGQTAGEGAHTPPPAAMTDLQPLQQMMSSCSGAIITSVFSKWRWWWWWWRTASPWLCVLLYALHTKMPQHELSVVIFIRNIMLTSQHDEAGVWLSRVRW